MQASQIADLPGEELERYMRITEQLPMEGHKLHEGFVSEDTENRCLQITNYGEMIVLGSNDGRGRGKYNRGVFQQTYISDRQPSSPPN